MIRKIHIKNFKSLKDTGELEIKPITFLVGPNSSGKTSFINAILALRQTVESQDQRTPLILNDYVRLGAYKDVVFMHDEKKIIFFGFEGDNGARLDISFSAYRYGKTPGKIYVKSLVSNSKDVEIPLMEKNDFLEHDVHFTIQKKSGSGGHYLSLKGYEELGEQPIELLKFHRINTNRLERDLSKKIERNVREGDKEFKEILDALMNHPVVITNIVLGQNTDYIFNNVYHVGPLRDEPERIYIATGAYPSEVGKSGAGSVNILLFQDLIRDKAKRWLEEFNISSDFDMRELREGSKIYEIMLKDPHTRAEVNLSDVGFGASQILPIIVEGFFAPDGSLILLEQPEIHLHPKAQCTMGDLLVDIVTSGNKSLIVETHSDLLIDRVCKNILLGKIKQEEVVIYYFEPSEGGTCIRTVTINNNGQYENFPEGFFEERFDEAMEMAELMKPEE